jgi:EAL and modified HD-GYP domain-containing signal transduction protein
MSNIVKNARTALLLMNERGLPPTPANYTKIYNEISGLDADDESGAEAAGTKDIIENNHRLVRYLDDFASSLSASDGDVHEKLDKQENSIRQLITAVQQTGDVFHVIPVLKSILSLIIAVQNAIQPSRTASESQPPAAKHSHSHETKPDAATTTAEKHKVAEDTKIDGIPGVTEESSPFPPPPVHAKAAPKAKVEAPKVKSSFQMQLEEDVLYLGRLPILHTDHALFGYDLSLYASQLGRQQPEVQLVDLTNYLGKIGVECVTDNHFGFVQVTYDDLMNTDLKRLAGDQLVLEITDVSEIDQKALARCMELKERGFKLSLGDYFDYPVYDTVLRLFDYVKLDIHATSNFEMRNAISRLSEFSQIHRIARNVDSLTKLDQCKEMDFHLAQGHFFIHSDASTLGNANAQQTTLLVVLGQLLTDVDLPRIERAFNNQEELTINLLALVNSAAMGLSRKVDSLQQALVILGRRQLMRWVQVLLYSHSDIKSAPLLMQVATSRAKLMDLLCSTHADATKRTDIYRDRAFTVGILSLTHILLGMDLSQVIEQIGLDEEIGVALMQREGFLGHLLSLAEDVETAEFKAAEALMDGLNISPRDLNRAQKETLQWVHNLGKTAD